MKRKYNIGDILNNNGTPMYIITNIKNNEYEIGYTPDYTYIGIPWFASFKVLDSIQQIELDRVSRKKKQFQEQLINLLSE